MDEKPEITTQPPFKFEWTLNASLVRTTIFEKKKCVELIDVLKLYGFIKNELGISYQSVKRYEGGVVTLYKTELEQMINFKALYNRKMKYFQVAHKLAKHKWGRIIPMNYLSTSIFHRPTRHALCKEIYVDLDMINCQPSIINEICKHHNVTNDYLTKYVANPKKYREYIMKHHNCTKDTAKQLPIILMFGGTYNTWIKENDICTNEKKRIKDFIEMEKFMKTIIEIVYNANPQIKKDVLKQDKTKWRTEAEAKRGVMALWSQSVEKMIQEECIIYLVNKEIVKLEEVVPSQDGFMILKECNYPELCSELNELIKDKYNIDVGWLEKPFDESIEIPEYKSGVLTFEEWEDDLSVKCLADRFLEEFGNYVIKTRQGELNVYWGDKVNGEVINGRWYNETNTDKRYKLYLYISEDLYKLLRNDIVTAVELDEDDINSLLKTLRKNCSQSNKMNDIIKHILTKAKEIEDDFNSNPFLLGFNNGVYDLKNDIFRDYTYEDYITLTTKYDYKGVDDSEENKTIRKELNQIFEDIHPDKEHRKLFLQVLASGLDGRAYQKLFLFNGQGGNGKGLTGALMDSILGEYYFQPGNGILKDVERANAPSPDMYNLKNKRYINFKEVAGLIKVAVLRWVIIFDNSFKLVML